MQVPKPAKKSSQSGGTGFDNALDKHLIEHARTQRKLNFSNYDTFYCYTAY
jgi:hypothetical protein